MKRLQEVNDGLTTENQLKMIRMFQTDEGAAGTYLTLMNQSLRQAWIREQLELLQSQAASV